VRFPLDWLLTHAGPAIKFRALTEVARLTPAEADKVASLPFTHRPALLLAMQQAPDGTWDGGMLAIPSSRAEHFEEWIIETFDDNDELLLLCHGGPGRQGQRRNSQW